MTSITGPFVNNATITSILVNNQTFAGNVINSASGKIQPGAPTGIRVENNSTITGQIINSCSITVTGAGVWVGGTSGTHDADNVTLGIVNGTGAHITAGSTGIAVVYDSVFSGGVFNAGTIQSAKTGIRVYEVSIFGGSVISTGTITSTADAGIYVYYADSLSTGANFTGSVSNSGGISAKATGILVEENAYYGDFLGGVTNTGAITSTPITAFMSTRMRTAARPRPFPPSPAASPIRRWSRPRTPASTSTTMATPVISSAA